MLFRSDAVGFAAGVDHDGYDPDAVRLEQQRVLAPTRREDGIPPNQIEYKIRRLVNDYLQPPKVTRKMEIFQRRMEEAREDLESAMVARDAHELMRAMEASSILDCAEMGVAASLFRTESRWGLYHLRVEYPERDDADWLCHTLLRQGGGKPVCETRPVAPYLVPIAERERDAYHNQRIKAQA